MVAVIAFETALPHGLCVGVRMPEPAPGPQDAAGPGAKKGRSDAGQDWPGAAIAGLAAEEARFAAALHPGRRRSWVAGRLALRAALARLCVTPGALLPDDRGAPVLPPGVVGSISHKPALAVGLAAPDTGWRLGVDIEARAGSRLDIGRRILTEAERQDIAGLAPADRAREVMLRFSLKEAVYKAVDPFVRRYVGFREVEIAPRPDGTATVQHALEVALDIEARWTVRGDLFLTSARARHSHSSSAASLR